MEQLNIFVHNLKNNDPDGLPWPLFTHLPKAKLIYHLPTAEMSWFEGAGAFQLDAMSHVMYASHYVPSDLIPDNYLRQLETICHSQVSRRLIPFQKSSTPGTGTDSYHIQPESSVRSHRSRPIQERNKEASRG